MKKEPLKVKEVPIHLYTVKTMGTVVKLFDDAFKLFMADPTTDNYKDMESKREKMFVTCDTCMLTSFPSELSNKDAEALKVGRQAIAYREAQEKLSVI